MEVVLSGEVSEVTSARRDAAGGKQALPIDGAQIIDAHAERIYRFCQSLSRTEADAEDLAQETCLRVLRHSDRYDPDRGPLEGWLWRIALNTARDAGRARRRHLAILDRLLRLETDEIFSIESKVIDLLEDEELVNTVRRLGARDRTLIALRFDADLEYVTIAKLLHANESAVRRGTARALARLRRLLEDRHGR